MTATDAIVSMKSLILSRLRPGRIIHIELDTSITLAGRVLVSPNRQDLAYSLQIGAVLDDGIDWMAGPRLVQLDPVPRNGEYSTVIAHNNVAVGQQLVLSLLHHPTKTRTVGKVLDFE